MQKTLNHMKYIGVTLLGLTVIDLVAVFALAYGVYYGTLTYDNCNVMLVVLLILSAAIAAYAGDCMDKGALWGYLPGVFFLAAILVGLRVMGANPTLSGTVRALVAVFVGTFIGKFLNKITHNRLGKNKKKRRSATK